MSLTSNIHAERFAYHALDYRTIAEIQGNIDEKRDKNWFFRLLNAKSDKDEIASWDRDLTRVLHVFSVRSVGFVLHSLTPSLQIELELNIHGKVDGISQKLDVVLTNQEGTNRQHLSDVSPTPSRQTN